MADTNVLSPSTPYNGPPQMNESAIGIGMDDGGGGDAQAVAPASTVGENVSFRSMGKMATKWFGSTGDSPYPPFGRANASSALDQKSPLVENMVVDPAAVYSLTSLTGIGVPRGTQSPADQSSNMATTMGGPEFQDGGSVSPSLPPIKRKLLSTVSGVFAPVALSMFSVLLFLRLGFVVGHAGLAYTFVIYLLTYFILLTTVLSVAAVATNGAVEGGGAYFMISRTLGPEFGGGIGTVFFAANVFSSALYTVGCSEALIESFGPGGTYTSDGAGHLPEGPGYALLYATLINALNLVVCLSGSSAFARASLTVLGVVVVCALSVPLSLILRPGPFCVPLPTNNALVYAPFTPLAPAPSSSTTLTPSNFTPPVTASIPPLPTCGNYTGLSLATLMDNLGPSYGLDYTTGTPVTFMTVFAVVFSGATGIMAGANMSGDLRHPQKSIPRGTLIAVAFTFTTYVTLSVLVGGSCTRYLLQNDYIFLAQINVWAPFVTVGILLATVTAGLSNLIGASRVLEAVARDRIFGSALDRLTWATASGNPVPAVLVSWILVQAVVTMGSLNRIAGVTTVFFLLSYLALNVSCCALELASTPNFRPSFRYFSWYTALSGSLACLFMMFVVTPTFSSLGLVICALLVLALHWKTPAASWGSLSQALMFHQVRKYLLLLDPRKEHVKYWRPQILQLVADPRACCELIDFANDLKKSGLFVVGHVITTTSSSTPQKSSIHKLNESPAAANGTDPVATQTPYWLYLMDSLRVKAFVELTTSQTVREGCRQLMRLSGLGAMKPNTVILGFLDDRPATESLTDKPQLFRPKGKTRKFLAPSASANSTTFCWPLDSPSPPPLGRYNERNQPDHDSSLFTDSPTIHTSSRLSATEYVGILRDALAMNKNLILARNFTDLDKHGLFRGTFLSHILSPASATSTPQASDEGGARARPLRRGPTTCYIDVWPQNFFAPTTPPAYRSPATLFLLQLACVLNMVRSWNKRSTLRVFVCRDPENDDSSSHHHDAEVRTLLAQLRIPAEVHVVEWNVRRHFSQFFSTSPTSTALHHRRLSVEPEDVPLNVLSSEGEDVDQYLNYVNRLVSKYSLKATSPAVNFGVTAGVTVPTAVTFIYLPPPPAQFLDGTNGREGSTEVQYLHRLETLSRGLPPTCLIHGISDVTTTML